MKREDVEKIISTYEELTNLKELKRQGWKKWNIEGEEIESVAEHIYGTQMLAWTIIEQTNLDIDATKVMAMLSLHETEEIRIGDITPFDGITINQKKEMGKKAVDKVLGGLSKSNNMKSLIAEFEEAETKEAKFANLCDKLECDLQARRYQKQGRLKWERAPKEILDDERVQRAIKNGAKTIDKVFLSNDYFRYKDTMFQEIADYIKEDPKI